MFLCGLTDKDLRRICGSQCEHPGSIIGYWPETCLCHVYIVLKPVGSARLTFSDNQYYEFMCFDVPKVVQSPGFDHRHDEESQNGRDIKIDILEAYVWTSEWFRMSLGISGNRGQQGSVGCAPPRPKPNWFRALGAGCWCQNRRILGTGSRTMRLWINDNRRQGTQCLPRFGASRSR